RGARRRTPILSVGELTTRSERDIRSRTKNGLPNLELRSIDDLLVRLPRRT
ncbi:hypothetical protein HPB47_006353, partial [Ixodes persulcatus]